MTQVTHLDITQIEDMWEDYRAISSSSTSVEETSSLEPTRFQRIVETIKNIKNTPILTHRNCKRAVKVLSLVAFYPIIKLAMTLIAGAAVTLTPLNIVLLAALALTLLITIAFLIKNRKTPIYGPAATLLVKNLLVVAAAPVTAPAILGASISSIYKKSTARAQLKRPTILSAEL